MGQAAVTAEQAGLRLIVAWAVLTYAFFELMPTLLSHYILPAYPAFCLLAGYASTRMMEGEFLPVTRWISIVLFAFGAILLLTVSFPGVTTYFMAETAGDFTTALPDEILASWADYRQFPLWFWWLGFGLCGVAVIEFSRRHECNAAMYAIYASVAIGWHVRIFMLPGQVWVQPTETARLALEDVCGVPGEACDWPAPERILALGYAEPSYVLTLGTQNLHPPETPLDLPQDPSAYPIVYLLNFEDRKAEPPIEDELNHLRQQARQMDLCISETESYYALNYSNGDPVNFRAVRFDYGGCPDPG